MNDGRGSSVPLAEKSAALRKRVAIVVSVVISVVGMLCLVLLPTEFLKKPNSIIASLILYGLALPTYIALQGITEEVLRGMFAQGKWPSRLLAVVIIIAFYAIWFYRHM